MSVATDVVLLPLAAGAGDEAANFSLYCELLRQHIEPAFGWDLEFQRTRFRNEYPSDHTSLILCEDVPCGFLVTTMRERALHVSLLLIRPESQRRGIGQAVMAGLVQEAGRRQLAVTLSCFKSNYAARRFYEKLGFEACREDVHFVELSHAG